MLRLKSLGLLLLASALAPSIAFLPPPAAPHGRCLIKMEAKHGADKPKLPSPGGVLRAFSAVAFLATQTLGGLSANAIQAESFLGTTSTPLIAEAACVDILSFGVCADADQDAKSAHVSIKALGRTLTEFDVGADKPVDINVDPGVFKLGMSVRIKDKAVVVEGDFRPVLSKNKHFGPTTILRV